MKKIFLYTLIYVLVVSVVSFAEESQDKLKKYLGDMNRIVIEVELTMRNMSLNILMPESAVGKVTSSIEKFEALVPPSVFSKDHSAFLSALKTMRDGLKLFSEGEREKSVDLIKKGGRVFKGAAINIKTIAEKKGLIPPRPKSKQTAKPILPPQMLSVSAGPSPTLSPHIASPGIERDFITTESEGVTDIDLGDITDIASMPSMSGAQLPVALTIAGEIVSMKPVEDHFIVGLKDDSGNILEITLRPGVCTILKDNNIAGIDQVVKGASSYILYTKSDNKNHAALINILKPVR